MPRLISNEAMPHEQSGQGWVKTTLADASVIGQPAMEAYVWVFDPNAQGPESVHGDADQLFYVIRGGGQAVVGDQRLVLKPESMVWMEPGDRYRFEAGDEGLEILQGLAPGGAQ